MDHEVALNPWAVALNLPMQEGEGAPLPSAEIIPPADASGVVKGRDGRRFRMKDPATLAAAINAQAVAARIDFDHRSERSSPTFNGSTAAEGSLPTEGRGEEGFIEPAIALL